ncbi:MAG: hypothetical protein ACYCW6_25095 [Candidatus Xenobia bacterium]
MGKQHLPRDFKDFLRLLNEHEVTCLLIGGYAVGYHGYARATGDMDVWVPRDEATAERLTRVLRAFGFDTPETGPELFLRDRVIVRMGYPPCRIEVTNHIDGVDFADCYERRVVAEIDEVRVSIIGLGDLKINKRASGRLKDLDDLDHLP